MKILRLAWSGLRRDWRSGELRLIAAALLIAVTSISAVTMFIDRALNAVETQAGALLAADLALESGNTLPDSITDQARKFGLRSASILSFRSVIGVGDKLQLTEIKAVDRSYPLRGHLETSTRPFEPGIPVTEPPSPGSAWADTQLFQILTLTAGQTISLGELQLPVQRVLLLEPDRGGDLFSIAPRVLVNIDDIPATKLILPGSRVTYRYLLAGERSQLTAFQAWFDTLQPQPGIKLISTKDARVEVRDAITRADQFLGLAALASVVLSGIAIANAARRFAARHLDTSAIMRCLGARQATVLAIFITELLLLYLLVSVLALSLAYATQHVLAHLLAGLVAGDLPAPRILPAVSGTVTGLAVLVGFGLPPLLNLKDVPPARVLRRDLGESPRRTLWVYLLAVLTVSALAPWQVGQSLMTLYVLLGSAVTVLVLGLAAWVLVKILGRLRNRVGIAWRYGLANIARRSSGSVVQVVGLGLGIMVMLVLGLVRGDLLQGWLQHLPPNANNHFLVNIQPDEVPGVEQFFADHNLPVPKLLPMVRGRLLSINDRPVHPDDYPSAKAKRLAEREFNLSWSSALQADNTLTQGTWWQGEHPDNKQFSVEKGIAETLGIKLGDALSYQVGDQTVTAKVVNLREVNWDTFNVNFFVIAPPGLLEHYPNTYITSLYLAPQQKVILSDLVRQFPSITVVDVAAIMDHVRGIMDRVAVAAQFVFLFTLGAGMLVLIAAIQATHDERMQESALLRSLGASNRTVAQGLAAEFVVLGLLAGLLASIAAIVVGYVLAQYVFKVDYVLNVWLVPIGLLGGGLGVGVVGLLGTRKVRNNPPLAVLRQS
jgi:putative ABC transport system permease protein